MNIEKIFEKYKPELEGLKNEFSVLILLIKLNGKDHIIFEKRSKYISQPGEVSLPGGKVELGENLEFTARREGSEELGTDISNIKIIGEMDYLYDLNNNIIRIFIGELINFSVDDFKENSEVEYIFTYPISYFLETDPIIYNNEFKSQFDKNFPFELIPNGKKYNFDNPKREIYFYEDTKPIIWGLTAKIVSKFINICKGDN